MDSSLRQLRQDEYPPGLMEIPDPPRSLYLRGTLPPKGHKRLVVVGSRALSPYGERACSDLIMGLRGYPISIISGLALGTDAVAHAAALRAGLHTLAVPGSGLDDSVIGPRTNFPLAKEILKAGGGLLSEQEPLHRPFPKDFPARNRIMVGMADAVLVIEAGERSGTLITARLAAEYNRDLLCIPHRITDEHGAGNHLFLRLGAALITSPKHILEALGLPTTTVSVSTPLLGVESIVYELLSEPLTKDEVLQRAGLPASEVLTALVSLELNGRIELMLGCWQRRS